MTVNQYFITKENKYLRLKSGQTAVISLKEEVF